MTMTSLFCECSRVVKSSYAAWEGFVAEAQELVRTQGTAVGVGVCPLSSLKFTFE